MKCAYHPEREAVGLCSMCRKPLCEECGGQKAGTVRLCSRCTALSAARDAANGEVERQAKHKQRMAEAARKRKKPHVAMIVILILAGLVLLANAYMYLGPDVPEVAQFDPYQYPLITADLINEAIKHYAKEHEGRFPENLKDLLGKYIPYETITSQVVEMFSYRRFSPTSYELRFKEPSNVAFSDIVFGKEDQ